MTELLAGPPNSSATLRAMGVDALEAPASQVLGATIADTFAGSPVPRMLRALVDDSPPDAILGLEGVDPADMPASPMLDAQEANRRYGIPGKLQFDAPIAESTAASIHQTKVDQARRADIIARRGDSLAASVPVRMTAAFLTAAADPLNLATAFIPVIGEAKLGVLLANAGSGAARAGIRAGVGAAQGAVGMAALEPLQYALDQREHDDWKMTHALQSVAFGGLLGGGLHVIGGAIGDRIAAPRTRPGSLSERLEAAGPDAREAMLRGAVASVSSGEPVAVAPVLDLAETQSAYAGRLSARNASTQSGTYAAFTPGGHRVELRPEVVELDTLTASNLDGGEINPAYPAWRQPRDRTGAASQSQIHEMAARLEPERLGPSPEAATGAPIVGPDGVVDSGNGRVLALRRAYSDPRMQAQADAYRAFLAAQGYDVSGMRQPVLVGRRTAAMSDEQLRAFVTSANESQTLRMSAAEQARADAGRAANAIDQLAPGGIDGRQNAGFVARFMAQLPVEERAGMMLADGRLSAPGARRLQAAVIAHAYGDAVGPTLERMLNEDTAHMRGLANALIDVAADWGRMRAAAARGEIPAHLDITPALGEAVQLIDRARTANLPLGELLAQGDMLGGPSPAAAALVRLFFRDLDMRRPVGRERLADLLGRYAEQAQQAQAGPNLFGLPETTAPELLASIAGDDRRLSAAAQALRDAQSAEPPGPALASAQATRDAEAAANAPQGTGLALEPKTNPPPEAAQNAAGASEASAAVQGRGPAETPQAAASGAASQGSMDMPPSVPPGATEKPHGSTNAAPPMDDLFARLPPELAAARDLAERAEAVMLAERQAGRLADADLAPILAARQAAAEAEGTAAAAEQAAACLITRGATP